MSDSNEEDYVVFREANQYRLLSILAHSQSHTREHQLALRFDLPQSQGGTATRPSTPMLVQAEAGGGKGRLIL